MFLSSTHGSRERVWTSEQSPSNSAQTPPQISIIKHEKTKPGLTIDHLVWCENLHPRRLVYRGSSSGSVTPAIGAIAHRLLCCSFILTRLVLGQTEAEATPRK
jgi:hypothetical protein